METSQFDINIIDDNAWTNIEKISHELKHADQYLNRKLSFVINSSGRIFIDNYSRDDELEAFERQGLFGNTLSTNEIHKNYKSLKYYGNNKTLEPSLDKLLDNRKYYNYLGHPKDLYHGWENDIK